MMEILRGAPKWKGGYGYVWEKSSYEKKEKNENYTTTNIEVQTAIGSAKPKETRPMGSKKAKAMRGIEFDQLEVDRKHAEATELKALAAKVAALTN